MHSDWATGAEFGPSSRVEFLARAERGEPGVFPAPSGYSVYTQRQRAATGAAGAATVLRQGTASSRTGEYITNGALTVEQARGGGTRVSAAPGSLRDSPYRANALVAAKEAKGGGTAATIGSTSVKVYHIDVGTTSYAVFRKGGGILGGSGRLNTADGPAMEAALPALTGCTSVAGPFRIGPGGTVNTHMVYALNCG